MRARPAPSTPVFDCQACGACCANSRPNRRAGTGCYVEVAPGDRLARRPEVLHRLAVVNSSGETFLRLVGRQQRCVALEGVIGERVSCGIYALRPSACRRVKPGDRECLARRRERRVGGARRPG